MEEKFRIAVQRAIKAGVDIFHFGSGGEGQITAWRK